MFCVLYAIFGIPLCLVVLSGMGERFYKINKWLSDKVNCFSNPKLDMIGDFLVILILGMGIFILLPSVVFYCIEDWSYGTSLYYSFITLSTIGFGDYVAGKWTRNTGNMGLFKKHYCGRDSLGTCRIKAQICGILCGGKSDLHKTHLHLCKIHEKWHVCHHSQYSLPYSKMIEWTCI